MLGRGLLRKDSTKSARQTPVTWEVAPEGVSALMCSSCGQHFPEPTDGERVSWGQKQCDQCEHVTDHTDCQARVSPRAVKFFDDQTVMNSTWYHATEVGNGDWLSLVQNSTQQPMVHVGTREAAMDRYNDKIHVGKREDDIWMMYLVRLLPGTVVNKTVLADKSSEFPCSVQTLAKDSYRHYVDGANRYVNRWESPGSVSLLVNPTRLIQVASYRIER